MSSITRYWSKWLTAIFATALVLALLVGGQTREAEAIDPGETNIAYVADGYNFPDALMGATVAALNAAPMLGVRGPNTGDFVPDRTAAELDRLTNNKANKLDTIYIFGGPNAVSDNVKAELEAWANNVERIFGQDRFGTMEAISKALPAKVKDSDLLDGKDSTQLMNAVEGTNAGDDVQKNVGLNDASNTIQTIEVTAPTDGFLVLNAFTTWRNPIDTYMSLQLNDTTCNNTSKPSTIIFGGGDAESSVSVTAMVAVNAGAQTVSLCAGHFEGGTQILDFYAVTAVFSPVQM